jgi:hypothetical protein
MISETETKIILTEQTQNNAAGDGVLDQDLRNKKELA